MSADPTKKKLLLIGWDAADWNLITPLLDAGLKPNLARLIEGGVMGNIATLRPCLSPILWTSIATGKLADKHGILGFIEPAPDGGGVRLSSSTSRKTKAIWNILSQNKFRTHAVAWYASHPAEPISGVCVSDQFMGEIRARGEPWPMPEGAVHPPDLADEIARLRVHPAELRDTDLLPFIPQLSQIDMSQDPRPGKLAAALSKNTSVHAVATAILDAEPWDVLAVYYDAIDVVGHDFMIYHPPRLPQVSHRDFELYHRVMSGLYQFHDMMLGRLMQMAGDETAIMLVSDHGFYSDHLRPHTIGRQRDSEETASLWHRHYGVLVMRGPNLKRDERIYGATLLDVTPTILTTLGLPIGADMDGRVLLEAFAQPPAVQRIASWDSESGPADAGLHAPDLRQDPYLSSHAIEQLIELGYLPDPARDQRVAAEVARVEAQFNLAATHLYVGRADVARGILEVLYRNKPDEPRFAQWLARCYAKLDMHAECRATIEQSQLRFGRNVDGDLLLAAAMFNAGDTDAALRLIDDVQTRYPPSVVIHVVIGGMYLAQHRWAEAEQAYARACQLDDDSEQAHYGLSRALAEQGRFEESADHALRAVGLVHFFPAAHYQLGVALEGMGERERALRAMEAAVAMSPKFADAHRHLARIYMERGDVARSLEHERAAQGYGTPSNAAPPTPAPAAKS
jgi:predicted AlkP superfamily phosphohydrolase/phosphomutase/tetratricopeptide (TPR) repeat protein